MAENKLATLVSRLLEKTREDKLNWERTPRDGVFQVAFPEYVVKIFSRQSRMPDEENPENLPDYVIQVFDEKGQLEEFTDIDLRGVIEGGAFKPMQELHSLARRKALGTDKAIDKILSSLE